MKWWKAIYDIYNEVQFYIKYLFHTTSPLHMWAPVSLGISFKTKNKTKSEPRY